MSLTESPKTTWQYVLYFSFIALMLSINFVNHGGWFKLIVGIAATTVVVVAAMMLRRRCRLA